MNKEQLRMQMLAGVITEGQYKAKLEENKKSTKKSLKENFVGMGAINNPFIEREKIGYETAFEHFLGEKYELKEEMEEVEEEKEGKEELNENYEPNRMLELIEMYVDNYSDEGMSAEAAIKKIDQLLQGNLDDYDKAFMAGEEDQY